MLSGGGTGTENSVSTQANDDASGSVLINSTNFPDEYFRENIIKTFDTNSDGALSADEIAKITKIETSGYEASDIYDMTGVEYLTNLQTLKLDYLSAWKLDVSKNTKLKTLIINNYSTIEELILDGAVALEHLEIQGNTNLTLDKLDVSKNTNLKYLNCDTSTIRTLILGNNPNLETLSCRQTGNYYAMKTLDLSGCTGLKTLDCSENLLTGLDLSAQTNLKSAQLGQKVYTIDVGEDGTFDLKQLQGFDVTKTSEWYGAEVDNTTGILTVKPECRNITYKYDTGSTNPNYKLITFTLHWHNDQWKYSGSYHWKQCVNDNCTRGSNNRIDSGSHTYTSVKDKDCSRGCGYERSLYTVTTEKAQATLENETAALDVPVAQGAEVTLTAGTAPEEQEFSGWKLYKVTADAETEITNLKNLLDDSSKTPAVLKVPSYNVKAVAQYSSIQYDIETENCTADTDKAAKDETVTVTADEKPGQRFTGWKVTVDGEEKKADEFLTYPDENAKYKATFTMPNKGVKMEALYGSVLITPDKPVDDHHLVTVENGAVVKVDNNQVSSGTANISVVTGAAVTVRADEKSGYNFAGWTAQGLALSSEELEQPELTFEMPAHDVVVSAQYTRIPDPEPTPDPEPEEPEQVADGAATGTADVALGGAAFSAAVYAVGTQIWMETHLPDGVIPTSRQQLALMLWNAAGKPQPAETALYADISAEAVESQQAAHWCVEQGLMKDYGENFKPGAYVFRPQVIKAWNQVQKMQ